MYTHSFNLIKQRLKEIIELKEVAWYLGQYKTSEKNAQLCTTPSAYIEYMPSETDQQGKIQRSEITIKIHLVTTELNADDRRLNQDHTSNHMVLLDAVHKILNSRSGMMSDIDGYEDLKGTANDFRLFNSLSRSSITPPHEMSKQMVSIQQYKGLFYDQS
jgi:hypothetical protein